MRKAYEDSEEQVVLQMRDPETRCAATGKGRWYGGKGKGACQGSAAQYARAQTRNRLCRHLQRVCDTKQIWEVLVVSDRFDLELLKHILTTKEVDVHSDDAQFHRDGKPTRHELRHNRAQARTHYNEGWRLAH